VPHAHACTGSLVNRGLAPRLSCASVTVAFSFRFNGRGHLLRFYSATKHDLSARVRRILLRCSRCFHNSQIVSRTVLLYLHCSTVASKTLTTYLLALECMNLAQRSFRPTETFPLLSFHIDSNRDPVFALQTFSYLPSSIEQLPRSLLLT